MPSVPAGKGVSLLILKHSVKVFENPGIKHLSCLYLDCVAAP